MNKIEPGDLCVHAPWGRGPEEGGGGESDDECTSTGGTMVVCLPNEVITPTITS